MFLRFYAIQRLIYVFIFVVNTVVKIVLSDDVILFSRIFKKVSGSVQGVSSCIWKI